uniref:PHB domain-containing protein n=1 Tax=Meloidogyne hapla TaxID=6305 RepID=A0A1I8BEL5_MELHA
MEEFKISQYTKPVLDEYAGLFALKYDMKLGKLEKNDPPVGNRNVMLVNVEKVKIKTTRAQHKTPLMSSPITKVTTKTTQNTTPRMISPFTKFTTKIKETIITTNHVTSTRTYCRLKYHPAEYNGYGCLQPCWANINETIKEATQKPIQAVESIKLDVVKSVDAFRKIYRSDGNFDKKKAREAIDSAVKASHDFLSVTKVIHEENDKKLKKAQAKLKAAVEKATASKSVEDLKEADNALAEVGITIMEIETVGRKIDEVVEKHMKYTFLK